MLATLPPSCTYSIRPHFKYVDLLILIFTHTKKRLKLTPFTVHAASDVFRVGSFLINNTFR